MVYSLWNDDKNLKKLASLIAEDKDIINILIDNTVETDILIKDLKKQQKNIYALIKEYMIITGKDNYSSNCCHANLEYKLMGNTKSKIEIIKYLLNINETKAIKIKEHTTLLKTLIHNEEVLKTYREYSQNPDNNNKKNLLSKLIEDEAYLKWITINLDNIDKETYNKLKDYSWLELEASKINIKLLNKGK